MKIQIKSLIVGMQVKIRGTNHAFYETIYLLCIDHLTCIREKDINVSFSFFNSVQTQLSETL